MPREKTLEDAQALAASHGGQCLSTEYRNARTRMRWQCAQGHVWEATYNSIQQGSWCPECSGKKKNTLEDAQALAALCGGRCLSTSYKDAHTRMFWQCDQGHVWEAQYTSIQQGSWCPQCAGTKRKTLEDAQALAALRGGRCLSTSYKDAYTRMFWQCAQGHVWEAIYSSIQKGSWCPQCAGNKKHTLEDAQVLAALRGGRCLSTEYRDTHTRMRWQCAKGHIWETSYNNIQRNTWCPECAGTKEKTLEDAQALAASRGGKCLSTEYRNSHTHMHWQCDWGHVWKARYSNILQGRWCPQCAILNRTRDPKKTRKYLPVKPEK